MRKRKEVNTDFVAVKDKKFKHWSKYYKNIYLLTIDFKSYEDHGELKGWTLSSTLDAYSGTTKEEFFKVLKGIKETLDLKATGYSDDTVLIYIDKIAKVKGFFSEAITNEFGEVSVSLYDVFEVRSYLPWTEDPQEMQQIVNTFFIPERYFYLTPNQRMRKKIEKLRDEVVEAVYPDKYIDYKFIRQALFGGLCYCPYPGLEVPTPMISIDLKSAYIFSLLIEMHCVTRKKEVDPDTYEYYLNNEFETSIGVYNVTYTATTSMIKTYKDIYGQNLQKGEDVEVSIALTDIDLNLLMKMSGVYITKINCTYLETYELGHLPKKLMDVLVEEFIKKNALEKGTFEYRLQKVTLNGIYGNTIKTISSKQEFLNQQKKSGLCPQWGIWTTSYTKKLLLGLAKNLSGWVYSDTDSIYCADTAENRELIYHYNMQTQARIRDFCDQFGYDFEALKELGSFEVEYEIKKFKAIKRKEYLFTIEVQEKDEITGEEVTKDRIIVKAAGCNKEEMPLVDELYKVDKLPVGSRIFSYCDNGYYEKILDGEVAELEMVVREALLKY